MKDFMYRLIPLWLWVIIALVFGFLFGSKAMAQAIPFNGSNQIQNSGEPETMKV